MSSFDKALNKVMNIFNIPVRMKPKKRHKDYEVGENNWKQEQFEKNVTAGIQSLFNGKEVRIFNDSRSYETALAIKKGYILERNKILSEQISIDKIDKYTSIKMENKCT